MKTSAVNYLIRQLRNKKKIAPFDNEIRKIIAESLNIEKENILDAHYEKGMSLTNAQSYYVENYRTDIK